jgi:hypothetical protein
MFRHAHPYGLSAAEEHILERLAPAPGGATPKLLEQEVQLLNPVVALVGDVDGAGAVDGHAIRGV